MMGWKVDWSWARRVRAASDVVLFWTTMWGWKGCRSCGVRYGGEGLAQGGVEGFKGRGREGVGYAATEGAKAGHVDGEGLGDGGA